MTAPELSSGDIERELKRIFSTDRRAFVAALYGRGAAGRVTVEGRRWEVVPTACELELRARMPAPGEAAEEVGKVFLVDWTERPLPLDLACRLASGRIFQISRGARLAGLFGARQAEAGLLGTGLAQVLLSGEIDDLKKVPGLLLTRAEAMRRFLAAWADFPLGEELTLGRLAVWCLGSEAGLAMVRKAAQHDAWRKLRAEAEEFVVQEAGPVAGLLWRAWEQGLAARFVQVAVLVEAHGQHGDAVAAGLLEGRLTELAPGFGTELLAQAQELDPRGQPLLSTLLADIFAELDKGHHLPLLRTADELLPQESFASTRAVSRYLPSGYNARERIFAAALKSLVETPDFTAFTRLKVALGELGKHDLDDIRHTEHQRETRLLATRLAAYLVKRHQEASQPSSPPSSPAPGAAHQAALDLARTYAAEGGFVDWCRGRLRTPLPFHQELNAAALEVLAAADAFRRADDRHFSSALIAWIEAGRPAHEVSPIDRVTHQFVGELVQQNPKRRVLIILMDGMSWTVAVQLLSRLEDENWAPILWRPKGFTARTHLPPVLASLPTLTKVSRAAFFAGREEAKAGHHPGEDAKRWAGNKALLRANGEAALPELILRRDLMEGESLKAEVRKTIEGTSTVVGVVVNAIDEDLLGSNQVLHDYRSTEIKPLSGLLHAADGAERIVLLASDHGHVPGDAIKHRGRPLPKADRGGKRWRPLSPDEQVQPFELELPTDGYCPPGAERVAAIWDETYSHGHPAYGEHGGMSLAEVVVPTLLLGSKWLADLRVEEGNDLEIGPFPQPGWWRLEVRPARGERPPKPVPEGEQMSLLPLPPAPPAAAEPVATAVPLVDALRRSKIFQAQVEGQSPADVEKVLSFLEVLAAADDALSIDEFARRCQTRPSRVPGLVARMGMLLNYDGYAMVDYERAARRVVLRRSVLEQQYGLPR